ncbi:MAG TPA: MBL fold metallo-hydrolase [Candidatus Limnocylindria bacterium]|jgi:beta-lactamase superfamily II metal-dependent hydrolase|nr:MBL fold metallo-hydrolase [Candidatus Limnocylindria bacterium]
MHRLRYSLAFAVLFLGVATAARAAGPTIYWCDSEGGGSTLIVTPAGDSVLIDSGNPGGRDAGRIVHVIKDVAHLTKLDHLIVTHLHIDHFGGAAEIAQQIPVGNVWDNGLPDTDPDGNKTSTWPLTSKAYREMKVGERHRVEPGTIIPLKSGEHKIELRCLITRKEPWQPAGLHARTESQPAFKQEDTSDNANSSAWILQYETFRFYDGGDLTWNIEAKLVWPNQWVSPVDIYQVTHHGLDVSNNPWLVRALSPRVSVMNNGPTKGTAGEVLATLSSIPSLQAQYQVHTNVRPDGATNNCPDAQIANVMEKCSANFIQCSVDSDGKGYAMEIPATGYKRLFKTQVQ